MERQEMCGERTRIRYTLAMYQGAHRYGCRCTTVSEDQHYSQEPRISLLPRRHALWLDSRNGRWKLPCEDHSMRFRWEVFNVANLVLLNVQSTEVNLSPSLQQVAGAFGDYTGLLTQPRVMQFALRYEF